eukprot:scaffold79796_cov61-Attheya_sp.AAC.1
MMKPPSKHCKPGHGACITDCTKSAKHNTKTTHPDIKPNTPHAPYSPLPNPPPLPIGHPSQNTSTSRAPPAPITHPPSTTRNTKSKSKSMNDDLDEASASDLMIVVVPPSTSKTLSKTTEPKPKSVSAPQNDNDTNKETLPSPDNYCIPTVLTQCWLFCFKNVPQNTKPSKHKLPADHPTTTKVKSNDKKNLNNMATDLLHKEEACKEKKATAPVNVDEYVSHGKMLHTGCIVLGV